MPPSRRANTPMIFATPAMRNGDTGADAGGPQTLALNQGFENAFFGQMALRRSTYRQFLKQLLLGLGLQRGHHRFRGEQVGNIHAVSIEDGRNDIWRLVPQPARPGFAPKAAVQ